MDSQNDNSRQPKWLRRLERESWQAELIISGLAIYGCFQLPKFFYLVTDVLVSRLSMDYYFVGYMLTYMLLLGICLLTTIFILHFILRGYWVGLIGLNSVYPDGYNKEGGFYSPIYMDKMIKLVPSIKESIKAVDKNCSTLFAGACGFVMVYTSFAFVLMLLLMFVNLLDDYIGPKLAMIPAYIWIGIMSVMSVLGMLSSSKKFKHDQKFQDLYFSVSKRLSPFMLSLIHI